MRLAILLVLAAYALRAQNVDGRVINELTGAPVAFAVSATSPVHLGVKMQPALKISGRVLDSTGKPVALADVWLLWTDRY